MAPIAYDLFWDTKHLVSNTCDATLVPFADWEYVLAWMTTQQRELPNSILFEANFKVTQNSDYPSNDVNWPLMSPRMLQVLDEVGPFPYRLIPVRLVDRRALGPTRYAHDGTLRPEAADDRFTAVQLTEHLDAIDWGQSAFKESQVGPGTVYSFQKLVLREPPGGFPPLFRLTEHPSLLLISASARRALETAGIRGVAFEPLPGA